MILLKKDARLTDFDGNDSPLTGEVQAVQPKPDLPEGGDNILALISNYTERPDLLIAEIEKHDPGFVKKMNQRAEAISEETRKVRFEFSKIQAYATLFVQCLSALVVLYLFYILVSSEGTSKFWPIIGLTLFYAVSQGGKSGFMAIIQGLLSAIKSKTPNTPPEV